MLTRWPAAVLLLLATSLGAAGTAAAGERAWAGTGIVQAAGGRYLTDTSGRRLELHGVNLVGKCGGGAAPTVAAGTPCVGPATGPRLAYVLSPSARDPARRFTAADARTLVRLGFNSVRLGMIWEGLEPGPRGVSANDPVYCGPHRHGTRFPALGRADPYDPATVRAYLRRTDRIVALLARVGIRVIIDMHQDVWGSSFSYALGATPWNGEGAPPWATCTNNVAFVPPVGWGSAYEAPAVQTAIHHFWANNVRGDLQGQFARVWAAVARHYRGDPDVLGYDVINEPNDYSVKSVDRELQCDYGGPVHEPRSCRQSRPDALPDGLIGTIESADPSHVVLFEPSGSTDFGAAETIGITEPLRFPRLALAFHVYGDPGPQLALTAQERFHTRTEQPGGPPAIMDEFGASNNAPATAALVSLAGALNLSWTYWSAFQLDDPTAGDAYEGLLDQLTRKPYPAQARAVAVPYAWATAGTPSAQTFHARTGRYSYRYWVLPAIHAPTEIVLPDYDYPHGYRVLVQGARVVSARNAPLLELTPRRKAARVVVTVTRRR
ncbi:MAG TPA: cellulase family glycosylhydrolase [Solirubrobacteraceae bacterium]